ncbi:MAG: PHP domain-containing protein, partial [Deltaproteobacteria bacterium]|nr:PHP domain-containing protein [Deltaproteobacteria bacterium]
RKIISREALEEAHKEIFRSAGLQYIPVELREDTLILETAAKFEIPDLVDSRDIRGALHVHTTYSDGANGIEEIARACMERGLEYVGISDHSKSASYAGGLKEEDILRQHDEIDKLNRSFSGFRILKGIECDILPDGSLDYSEDILKRFDFIIASVHSRFRMSDEEMTARIVNAVETGYVNILGHLTGRLLLGREGYKLDVRRVIKACAANKTAIELNSDPMRLDLDWRNHAIAREHGVKIAICPDAHNIECLEFIRYGINIARKGMLTAGDIINTRNYKDIMEFFSKRGHIGDSYLWR